MKKPKLEDVRRSSEGGVDFKGFEVKIEVIEEPTQETDPLANLKMNDDDCRTPDETESDQIEKNMEEIHRSSKKEKSDTETASEIQTHSLEQVLDTLEENAKDKEQQYKIPRSKIIVKKFTTTGPEIRQGPFKEPEKEETIHKSKIGTFKSSVSIGPFNNSFCLADGYLFEYGLVKQGVR